MMESLKRVVLDALFPPRCVGCGTIGMLICSKCENSLPKHLPPFCSLCASRLPTRRVTGSFPRLCSRCAGSPLAIDGIRSVFTFDGVAREGILKLKYYGLKMLAGPLGSYVGHYLLANPLPVDTVVPVPLHINRLRERGYNQSALLARTAARVAGLKLMDQALIRIKDSPSQVGSASAEERRRNMQGAFRATGADVRGLRLLVLDDVCTTGSTLEACSLALRAAGAKSVWGVTVAREV